MNTIPFRGTRECQFGMLMPYRLATPAYHPGGFL